MADFHTHVTVSGVLGAGYSVAGMIAGMDPSTALVGGGLCGVAGMLPDVDSDSGIPRRETMGFAAAIVPLLLIDRFRQMQLEHDQIVLLGAAIYFLIRFVVGDLIGKFSVHRGMWHSIPAVLIFAGLTFLIAGPADDLTVRYFKAIGVALGSLSHLVLDEVYSVDTRGVVPKFKKSFGSAVKLYSKNGWANFSTYAKLAAVAVAISLEPSVFARIEATNPHLAGRIQHYRDRIGAYRQPAANAGVAPSPAPSPYAAPAANYPLPGYGAPAYASPSYNTPQPAASPFPVAPAGSYAPSAGQAPAPSIRRQ